MQKTGSSTKLQHGYCKAVYRSIGVKNNLYLMFFADERIFFFKFFIRNVVPNRRKQRNCEEGIKKEEDLTRKQCN